MATASYTLGAPPPNTKPTATFETKPTPTLWDSTPHDFDPRSRSRYDTGGGYERWRSIEYRPERGRKTDVYVPVHRLCAVAWLLPEDAPLSALDGADVHHTTGVEWANFGDSPNFDEPGLALLDHGRHSEITQAQIRAWGEDARERATTPTEAETPTCDRCDAEAGGLWASDDWAGAYCLDCAWSASEGATIREV